MTKKVMILSNDTAYTYNLRKEIIEGLIQDNYKVYIVVPYGEKIDLLKDMDCTLIDVPFNGRGKNVIDDLKLIKAYNQIIGDFKPDAVLSYTIKPNLYGGLVCRKYKIPFFPNITGLGAAVEKDGLLKEAVFQVYKSSFKKAKCIFFQNDDNKKRMIERVNLKKYKVLPGSGVNTSRFNFLEYPSSDTEINFVYIARVMKEKGIQQYLEAATIIKEKYPHVNFHVAGNSDSTYENIVREYHDKNIITYHGNVNDVRSLLQDMHCTVLPSYYEGMANTLLESASSGRPIITTTVPGCYETFDEDVTGFSMQVGNTETLVHAIEKFLELSYEEKERMGRMGREKMISEFDRSLVVKEYLEELNMVFN